MQARPAVTVVFFLTISISNPTESLMSRRYSPGGVFDPDLREQQRVGRMGIRVVVLSTLIRISHGKSWGL